MDGRSALTRLVEIQSCLVGHLTMRIVMMEICPQGTGVMLAVWLRVIGLVNQRRIRLAFVLRSVEMEFNMLLSNVTLVLTLAVDKTVVALLSDITASITPQQSEARASLS
jgi:hypothetical protein